MALSTVDSRLQVLATDLDGTLIPLPGNSQNRQDLQSLAQLVASNKLQLIYVSGRHFELVLSAIDEFNLPTPDAIICNVGTEIHEGQDTGFHRVAAFEATLARQLDSFDTAPLLNQLAQLDSVQLQEQEKLSQFKLSYYCVAEELHTVTTNVESIIASQQAPFRCVSSVDPESAVGLIDLLPQSVDKAFAIRWWCQQKKLPPENLVYAGDSGNDLAVFESAFPCVMVGNTADDVVRKALSARQSQASSSSLFHANAAATSGVLEGVQHFLAKQRPA